MPCQRIVGVIGLCLCLSGCQLASDITHNPNFEPGPSNHAHPPECAGSTDFACGFKAGYADYLEYGDDGHSPKLLPLRYRKPCRETRQGREAAKQWREGFRAGVAEAHASGCRQQMIVPVDKGGPQLPPPPPPLAASVPPPPLPAPLDDLPKPLSVPSPAPTARSHSLSDPLAPPTNRPSLAPHEAAEPTLDELPDPASVQSPEPAPRSRSLSAPLAPPMLRQSPAIVAAALDARSSLPIIRTPPSPRLVVPREPLPPVQRIPVLPPSPPPQAARQPSIQQPTAMLVEENQPTQEADKASDLPRIITGRAAVEAASGMDWSRIPRNAEMLSRIGQVALHAGSTEAGVQWLNAALQVDPHHTATHKALMEYYEKKGDFFRAAEHRAHAETP